MTCVLLVLLLAADDELLRLEDRLSQQRQKLLLQKEQIRLLKAEMEEQQRQFQAWQKPIVAAKPPKRPTGIHINSGQEIFTAPEDSPAFHLGPADVRIQGYVGLSGIVRTTSMGGGPGTSFASVPAPNTPAGNISEFRLTTQTSRIAIRVDVPLKTDKLTGYFESDFSGATTGNAVISSSSYGFRVRHAWVDYRGKKFEVAGGQMFSLLTPSRTDIQAWPGDVVTTQAVDTNYVAGLVWDRSPGIRAVYRPNNTWSFATSIENPEQQTGKLVKFPAALNQILSTQYNTGQAELKTPNVAPDFIFKLAFNTKIANRPLHLDAGMLLRFFRSYDPLNITSHKTAQGTGGNLNLTFDLTKRVRLIAQGFVSSGGGRYIGGIVPDVMVRANGDISPIKAHSWVTGMEWTATRKSSYFGYYSGVYAAKNTARDLDGTAIGFGYDGSNAARRIVGEWTGGWARALWAGEDAGSIQFSTQYSYLTNNPWWTGPGPSNARVHLIMGQLRYNLP